MGLKKQGGKRTLKGTPSCASGMEVTKIRPKNSSRLSARGILTGSASLDSTRAELEIAKSTINSYRLCDSYCLRFRI